MELSPFNIKILGYTWKVDTTKKRHEIGAFGRAVGEEQLILIGADMVEEQQKSTLLHEVIEASSMLLGLELNEKQIQGLEVALFPLMEVKREIDN